MEDLNSEALKKRRYLRGKIHPHWQKTKHLQKDAGQTSKNTPGYWRMRKDTARAFQKLEEEGDIDLLTGILNRKGLTRRFDEEKERKARIKYLGLKPADAVLIFFDANDLKSINDKSRAKHDAGDAYIKAIADLVSKSLKPEDIFGRYGADEFVIYAPNTNLEEGRILWERIAQILHGFKNEEMEIPQIWVSAGMTSVEDNIEDALKRADSLMYVAKEASKRNFNSSGQKINMLRTSRNVAVPFHKN